MWFSQKCVIFNFLWHILSYMNRRMCVIFCNRNFFVCKTCQKIEMYKRLQQKGTKIFQFATLLLIIKYYKWLFDIIRDMSKMNRIVYENFIVYKGTISYRVFCNFSEKKFHIKNKQKIWEIFFSSKKNFM